MSEEYKNRLKLLLRSLFQFDSADLDFGIYRIMNKKRDEIKRFIDKDLIDAVDVELRKYSGSKQANVKEDVEVIKAEIREKLGQDALDETEHIKKILLTTPFAKELDERYRKMHVEIKDSEMSSQHEAEIFSHIYQFFSRYYDKGDFMSLRRYSQKEKYAIPYNGEEVVLHWANKDQYYIKTGEYFKNYSFKMGEYTVEFRILEAESTTNNNKAESRFFVPSSSDPVYDASKKLLTIFFEYRGLNKDDEKEYGTKNVQDAIITKMKDTISSKVQENGLKAALNKTVDKETEKTVLEKHLRAYTQRNTTDYFIHKDLKGFLTRELDFYIKNEVFHLDDLGTEKEADVAQYMSRMRVIKSICLNIIDFLSQIEDFQKLLFEKKKFVLRTDYCMTLDNVSLELYPEILKNKEQLNEWKTLYSAGEEKQSTTTSFGSKSIDEAYLKEHPYLAVDTKFFDRKFKDELLASFDDLDEATGGLMIKSENWQALNLMQERYREQVKCIHVDPPYNTATSGFLYKNDYQHSSWLAMMDNRIEAGIVLMSPEGSYLCHIDENEYEHLKLLFERFSIPDAGTIAWDKRNPMNAGRGVATQHEYIIWRSKQETPIYLRNKNILSMLRAAAAIVKKYGRVLEEAQREYADWVNSNSELSGGEKAYRYLDEQGHVYQSVSLRAPEPRTNPKFHEPLIHPVTGKPCSIPPNGFSRTPETLQAMVERGEIIFGSDEKTQPRQKVFLTEESKRQISSVIQEGRKGKAYLSPLGLDFPYCHPVSLYEELLGAAVQSPSDIVLDYFAGSGTTAHAVLNLNKEDNHNHKYISRKYILIEMGDYFDTIMKPRIQKVIYSKDWKDGKPQSNDGISHIFKYQYLEKYEDTLNNIEFKDAGSYQRTLSEMDGYFLRYMLDFETRDGSPCRFNVEKLTKPFDYTLRITHGNELKDEKVDIVETFNYLLGIYVKQIKTFNSSGKYYRVVFGRKNEDEIVIIWRDTENIDLKTDKAFIEGTILSGIKPSKIYINADFYVEKALPIEPEFKKLMVV
jgi:adenine-specific DNA-methyltransferase